MLFTILWGWVGAWTLGDRNLTSWPVFSEYSPPTCFRGVSEAHTFVVTVSLTKSNYKSWNWVVTVLELHSVSSLKLYLFVFEIKYFHWAKFSQDTTEASTQVLAGFSNTPWRCPIALPGIPDIAAAFTPWHLSLFPGWSPLFGRMSSGFSVQGLAWKEVIDLPVLPKVTLLWCLLFGSLSAPGLSLGYAFSPG